MTELLQTERERRLELADKIKSLDDVTLPHLDFWNYSACERHQDIGPQVDCPYRLCGGDLFAHQRVAATWLYTVKKGLLASDPGTGKTSMILSLIALLKQKNELRRRAVIIPGTPAVKQWAAEGARWIPNIKVLTVDASMPRPKRVAAYGTDWDVLIIGSHLLISDQDRLSRLGPYDLVVNDDVDALLKHDNRTARAIKDISRNATRSFTVNATVIQTALQQLHGAYVPAGGDDLFGGLAQFENRYVDTQMVTEYTPKGTRIKRRQAVGYKNVDELKSKISSVYLRQRATELTDIRMPMIMPPQIEWFDMSGPQRERYAELQAGILRLIKEEGTQVKQLTALTQWIHGQQICAGLQALGEPDVPGISSPKLDRVFERLTTSWADRKTIVFMRNVGMVKAAIGRVQNLDFDCAMVWGQKQNAKQRQEQVTKFWEDASCRVMFGTTSLERSLNLQCANTVVALDTQLNPARVRQLVGRSARAGSAYDRVFVYQYMMRNTQEEAYEMVLRRRQSVSDTVFNEDSELFEKLEPLQLLQLMRPGN